MPCDFKSPAVAGWGRLTEITGATQLIYAFGTIRKPDTGLELAGLS